MSTKEVIERFIHEELLFGNQQTTVRPDESLIRSGLLDSLALLRLIVFLEEQFGVVVEEGEVIPDNFQTIERINAFVERKQPVH